MLCKFFVRFVKFKSKQLQHVMQFQHYGAIPALGIFDILKYFFKELFFFHEKIFIKECFYFQYIPDVRKISVYAGA